MPPLPFSLTRWRAHRDRGRTSFLHQRVCEDLADRLGAVNRGFARALFLGAPEAMAEAIASRPDLANKIDAATFADVSCAFLPRGGVACAPEAFPFAPASFDLIVSPLFLHWTNDLPGALIQMRHTLKPDGLLLASVFGGESLRELRASLLEAEIALRGGAGARIAPFGDARDFASLLQRAGLALPVTDVDRVTVSYRDPFKLFADLREMGERSALAAPAPPLTRAILLEAMTRYARNFATEDGRVRATFDIITLTGWAPAPGQPQPLRPGSAQVRLATALGVAEHTAGERAAPAPLKKS